MISKKEKRKAKIQLELIKANTMLFTAATVFFLALFIVNLGSNGNDAISSSGLIDSFGVPTLFYPRGTLLISLIVSGMGLIVSTVTFLQWDKEYRLLELRQAITDRKYGRVSGNLELELKIDPKIKSIQELHFEKQVVEVKDEEGNQENIRGLI